ncbi:unnamed protein product [Periconia digitata]|uniref:Uncharacterized protein n=1 Tax=Periconia digitata TaxID=1303443 RepID=A0A9W4UNB3_9PLEO|nr:unnamed protein product [Periconia digitata]
MIFLFSLIFLASFLLTPAHTHLLHQRDFDPSKIADDAVWEKLKCKGAALLSSIHSSTNPQSIWKGDLKHELSTWGYKEGYASYINCDMKGYWGVETACKALGLDTRPKMMGGPNLCYNFQHYDAGAGVPASKQEYEVDGKKYRVTGAELQIAVNPSGGVIFQQYVTSPMTAAKDLWNRDPALNELPELRALSDIMWGAWNRDNPDVKKIRYFWVQGVGNTQTKAVIARSLKNVGKQLELWPGTTFGMDSDEGLAMLGRCISENLLGRLGAGSDDSRADHIGVGSANAACFGFFLGMHQAELGRLTIDKVQVFKSESSSNPDPDLLFYVQEDTG